MLRWFAEAGYAGDIAAVRREHPGALTFEAWLRQSAGRRWREGLAVAAMLL
jgi:hypothetical protein